LLPYKVMLCTTKLQTDLYDLFVEKPKSYTCARSLYRLLNAVTNLHNLGFRHRSLRPESIYINTIPELEVRIGHFHRSSSIYDGEIYKPDADCYYSFQKIGWHGSD
jgi:serine/threonine protein kinase